MLQLQHESARMPEAQNGAPALRLLQEFPGIADIVWAVLARVDPKHDPVRLGFASADRRSGNSVLAAATAIGLVRHARVPVCLVEANVQHPALAGYLGLRNTGLSDLLDGRAELEDCLQSPRDCPGLYVLPGGTPRKPVSGEFATERMRSLLERIGSLGRYLVLDAPCLLEQLESRLLLKQVDASLLVLRAGATRLDAAARAHRILLEAGAPLLGSIFNAYGPARSFSRNLPYQLSRDELEPQQALSNGKHPTSNGTPPPESADALDPLGEHTNGAAAALNGATLQELGENLEAAHRHEVDLLERRIAKLTALLSQTEADLSRIASSKNIDSGLASIYRSVQGLSSEAEALALKRDLMGKIFQANLDLKNAAQRRS
jgi:Mrp family chromosome partitioning ATPase